MLIKTKFSIGERVFLVGNDQHPAVVRGYRVFGKNLFCTVDYWFGGDMKTIDVFEEELSSSQNTQHVRIGI